MNGQCSLRLFSDQNIFMLKNMVVKLVLLGVHMLNARHWKTSTFVVAKNKVV